MTAESVTPKVAVETITPEAAKRLLDGNTHNRKLREARVEEIAGAIARGEWELNGETIKIATDGSLLDGQHRLAACAKANAPIQTFVARGLPPTAQETVDTGARRTIGDVLRLRHTSDPNTTAAALRYLYVYLTERTFAPPRVAPTAQQLVALLGRHPDLHESIAPAKAVSRRLKMAPAPLAALHYLFAAADEDGADDFFAKLVTGLGLDEDSPIYTLRRGLERARESATQPPPWMKAAWVVKAWNAYRTGSRIQNVSFRPGGPRPEAFPLVGGVDPQDLDDLAR